MVSLELKPSATLPHVQAVKRALRLLTSVKDTEPEVLEFKDGTASTVTCTFVGGRGQIQAQTYQPSIAMQHSDLQELTMTAALGSPVVLILPMPCTMQASAVAALFLYLIKSFGLKPTLLRPSKAA